MNFGDLQTYSRQRIGIENNQTIQDSQLRTYLNMSLGNLDSILCTDYEDYNLQTYLATIGGAAGGGIINNVIPLPPDFCKLRGVDFGAPGAWTTLFGFGLQQRNRFNNPYSNMYANYGNQVCRKVRVMDRKIYVEPLNLCSGQYQIWYTPKFVPFATDGTDDEAPLPDAMDTQGFIEYAVASTGIKVYENLLLDTSGFRTEMAYYEEMTRNGAKNRMSNGPQCVQNVRNHGGGWGFGRWGYG